MIIAGVPLEAVGFWLLAMVTILQAMQAITYIQTPNANRQQPIANSPSTLIIPEFVLFSIHVAGMGDACGLCVTAAG